MIYQNYNHQISKESRESRDSHESQHQPHENHQHEQQQHPPKPVQQELHHQQNVASVMSSSPESTTPATPTSEETQPKKRPPFVLRGYRFFNGTKCSGMCFLLMVGVGVGLLVVGIGHVAVNSHYNDEGYEDGVSVFGVLMLLVGILLMVPGCCLCCLAHRQFSDLPHDHPHRNKYGAGYVIEPSVTPSRVASFVRPVTSSPNSYVPQVTSSNSPTSYVLPITTSSTPNSHGYVLGYEAADSNTHSSSGQTKMYTPPVEEWTDDYAHLPLGPHETYPQVDWQHDTQPQNIPGQTINSDYNGGGMGRFPVGVHDIQKVPTGGQTNVHYQAGPHNDNPPPYSEIAYIN